MNVLDRFGLLNLRHKSLCYFALWMMTLPVACSRDYSPKPSAYFHIDLPESSYHSIIYSDSNSLSLRHFPFEFEISDQAIVENVVDSSQSRWFDIDYPRYRARVYCSYFPVTAANFPTIAAESKEMAYFHAIKANGIEEYVFDNPAKNVYGIVYEIKGNVASPIQFVVTDSVRSFFRGALYFDNPPNQDSIAPVLAYINQDIHIIFETFRWKQ
jgi:gliding motility-associated lipoprotein GldD